MKINRVIDFTWISTQLSNVEFVRCGQRGFTELYDPRFSLAFLDVGDVTQQETESYVRKCSFNINYNVAIGTIGTRCEH